MTDRNADVSRRGFLRATAGGTAVTAAAGTAGAQETGTAAGNGSAGNGSAGNESGGGAAEPAGTPDFGGYLSDANLYDGNVVDATGQKTATVAVGAGEGFAFDPPAIHVSAGTTVQWDWTGEGGAHNVVSDDETFESGSAVSATGVEFEYTFEEDGIYKYFCSPHQGQGMLGAIVVGTDYPTVAPESGGGGGPLLPNSARAMGVGASVVMAATLGLGYFFMKYGGDYETPG